MKASTCQYRLSCFWSQLLCYNIMKLSFDDSTVNLKRYYQTIILFFSELCYFFEIFLNSFNQVILFCFYYVSPQKIDNYLNI